MFTLTPVVDKIKAALESGPKTRRMLSEMTNTARSTIYDNIERLVKNGDVIRFYQSSGGRSGRPHVFFKLANRVD